MCKCKDRSRYTGFEDELRTLLPPVASHDGLIVKVVPPRELVDERLDHVPGEIVLVIDVLGSMHDSASPPS